MPSPKRSPSTAPRSGRHADLVVDLVDRQRRVRIGQSWLVGLVRRALVAEGIQAAEVSVLLVDDRRIARVHDEWMGDATATDVITFDLSAPAGAPDSDGTLRGDIVVSTETAARMAPQVGWTARSETAYYVVHGILHLTGHDDLAPGPRQVMRRRERTLMASLGLPLPPRGKGEAKPATPRPAPAKRSRR